MAYLRIVFWSLSSQGIIYIGMQVKSWYLLINIKRLQNSIPVLCVLCCYKQQENNGGDRTDMFLNLDLCIFKECFSTYVYIHIICTVYKRVLSDGQYTFMFFFFFVSSPFAENALCLVNILHYAFHFFFSFFVIFFFLVLYLFFFLLCYPPRTLI